MYSPGFIPTSFPCSHVLVPSPVYQVPFRTTQCRSSGCVCGRLITFGGTLLSVAQHPALAGGPSRTAVCTPSLLFSVVVHLNLSIFSRMNSRDGNVPNSACRFAPGAAACCAFSEI